MQHLSKSLDLLATVLQTISGEDALYFSNENEYKVRVIVGKNTAKTENEASLSVDARHFDVLIPVCEFDVTPQVGDRIEVGKFIFEVLDTYGTGCWQLSNCRNFKRIHTKQLEKQ
ncbi:MAG: hypothetical protein ACRCUY_06370 [Thermoguttaceae bacterium]